MEAYQVDSVLPAPPMVSIAGGPARVKGGMESPDAEEDTSPKIKSFKVSATPKKSILKKSSSPDVKKKQGAVLAWPDFHGKELVSVMEYDVSDDEESDTEDPWENEKRPCCTIM